MILWKRALTALSIRSFQGLLLFRLLSTCRSQGDLVTVQILTGWDYVGPGTLSAFLTDPPDAYAALAQTVL